MYFTLPWIFFLWSPDVLFSPFSPSNVLTKGQKICVSTCCPWASCSPTYPIHHYKGNHRLLTTATCIIQEFIQRLYLLWNLPVFYHITPECKNRRFIFMKVPKIHSDIRWVLSQFSVPFHWDAVCIGNMQSESFSVAQAVKHTYMNTYIHTVFDLFQTESVQYDNTYRMTIGKLLSFHFMLNRSFCCVANHTLYDNIFLSFGLRFSRMAWLQAGHFGICMANTNKRGNYRMTGTQRGPVKWLVIMYFLTLHRPNDVAALRSLSGLSDLW